VYEMAVKLGETNGPRWKPGKLLERLAKEGKGWDNA
jgi:3-hydroxyacyl-CoA dehydrogenase